MLKLKKRLKLKIQLNKFNMLIKSSKYLLNVLQKNQFTKKILQKNLFILKRLLKKKSKYLQKKLLKYLLKKLQKFLLKQLLKDLSQERKLLKEKFMQKRMYINQELIILKVLQMLIQNLKLIHQNRWLNNQLWKQVN